MQLQQKNSQNLQIRLLLKKANYLGKGLAVPSLNKSFETKRLLTIMFFIPKYLLNHHIFLLSEPIFVFRCIYLNNHSTIIHKPLAKVKSNFNPTDSNDPNLKELIINSTEIPSKPIDF